MEENNQERKLHKKHLLAILVVIVVGIELYLLNTQNNNIDMNNDIIIDTSEQDTNSEIPEPLEYSGEELFYQELNFSDMKIIEFSIENPARIWVEWKTDNPTDFLMFNEIRCNEWKEIARIGIPKLRTMGFTTEFGGRTDINNDEQGNYCFLFFPENSEETHGTVKILEIARF